MADNSFRTAGRRHLPAHLPYAAAAMLAGVAAHYTWFLQVGGGGALYLALWFAMGYLASLGAARVVLLVAPDVSVASPSLAICILAYVVGWVVTASMPEAWLEVLDFAGFGLWVLLAVGWLVGIGDWAMRLSTRLTGPKRHGGED